MVSFELRRLYPWRKSCRYLLNGKLGGPQTCVGNRTQKGPAGILWYFITFLHANIFLKYLWSYSCWYSRKFRNLKTGQYAASKCLPTADSVSCPRSTESSTTPLIKPKKSPIATCWWRTSSCEIVGFRGGWIGFFRLLGYYAAWSGFKPTFREYLPLSYARIKIYKKTLKRGQDVAREPSILNLLTLRNNPKDGKIQHPPDHELWVSKHVKVHS
jgi:hypothetical protein